MAIEYVTVTDIEVASAGMAWNGMGGPYYVTAEHLADMVTAQADPLIRAARVKLGHIDPRFNGALSSHDPWNLDAEPAFGTLINLRTTEGGAKLVADAIEVPADLAASLPSAFPNRSMEWVWDYETEGGHRYSAVLTDVALLGTRMQAVSDLADIVRANLPAAVADPILADLTAAASAKKETTLPDHPALSVSVDRICHLFEYEWAVDPDSFDGVDTYWWWARDVRVDPDEVIASDGEGGTWRVPFITDGEYDVTFGQPVEVRQTYVDVNAATAAASAAQARHGQQVLAANRPQPVKQDPPNPAASRPRPTEEVPTVALDIPALRSRLQLSEEQLPDDATEDQINTVLSAEPETPGPEAEAEMPAPEAEVTEPVAPAATSDGVRSALGLPSTATDEQVRDRVAELEAGARAGASVQAEQIKTGRDALVEAAVKDGRIPPSARAAWRDALDKRPDAEAAALAALTAGRIPVDERGVATTGESTELMTTGLFPQLTSKEA